MKSAILIDKKLQKHPEISEVGGDVRLDQQLREGDREFYALGCCLAALCRPAGVIWVVGREIGNFMPWGAV